MAMYQAAGLILRTLSPGLDEDNVTGAALNAQSPMQMKRRHSDDSKTVDHYMSA